MRPRQINMLRHGISTRQALNILLECWGDRRDLPVILIMDKNEIPNMIRRLRVTLAKERQKLDRSARVAYGFTVSDRFPYTDGTQRGEAAVIRWRLTPIQNLKNMRDSIFGKVDIHAN